MSWFNLKHLEQANKYSGKTRSKIGSYFWHFLMSMEEAVKLFLLALGSIIHAVFPWVLNFKLLEWRIAMLKKLKRSLPEDPNLKKVDFLD